MSDDIDDIDDSNEAGRARAKRLRREIDKLTHKSESEIDQADETDAPADEETGTSVDRPAQAESPRDFIHRRMRQLDKRKGPDKD